MRYKAIRDNVGFMGRYWSEGDITPDVDEMAAQQSAVALVAHFKPIGEARQAQVEPLPPDSDGQALPAQYMSEITNQRADFTKKTVAELRLIAAESGIDIPANAKKEEILELLG